MNELSINMKIEMKKSVQLSLIKEAGLDIRDVYKGLNKDFFLLPYRVKKLSKKASRNKGI